MRVAFWKKSVMLLLFSFALSSAYSQITGTVLDDENNPLIGVSVSQKGTTVGTQTNVEGKYSIQANPNTILVFSFVGYAPKEVLVGNQSKIDVNLEVDDKLLSEVVVVGYGSQLKREVTGAVQTVDYKELQDLPVSQVAQKLQGQVAGVQINQTTGKPGQGMNVRIRGQLSVSAGSTPLYVIDGFPITGDIANLNPDEIQDITILKDAASTSLYGSRAANGVVLVTTKRGSKSGTTVSLNAFTGIQTVPMKGRIEMMDAVEFAQFKKEYYEDQGSPVPVEFQNPSQYEGKNNDWYDALLRDAPLQSYTLNVASNKGNSRTAVVAGVFNQQGVVLNNKYQRYSLRVNSEYDISKQVKLGFNLAPQYVYDNTPRTDGTRGQGILFNALHTWPVMPIYDDQGELTLFNRFPGSTGNIFAYPNYVRSAQELVNETSQLNLLSNVFASYEPIEGLVLKTSFNVEMGRSKYFFFNPSTATFRINTPIPTTATTFRENNESISWLNENLATYSKSINDHNFEILAGYTNQTFSNELTAISADTYADDRVPTVQGAININRGGSRNDVQEWSLTSLLSRVTYNYKGKYLFTAAVRRDGSSRFGADNRWGTFPSVSAGWVMSDESFLNKYENLSFAKLRASYGVIGNNNIGNYTSYALVDNTVNAVFGSNVVAGARVTSLANPNLGWETTRQFDIGLDLGFFNDRIQFIYDFYTKNTTNLLYSVQVAQESGFSNFNDNIGEIKFWGHEFALNTKNITNGKLRWNTNFNISFNRNRVIALADGIDRVYGDYHITQVGQPFGQFYGHIADGVYLNQADLDSSPQVPGRSTVGSIKLLDINGDGIITRGGDNDDRAIMGNPFPDFVFGITNSFNYKNFDLNIVGSGSVGNQLLVRHLFSTANLDGVFNMVKEVQYRFRSVENPGKGFYGTTVGGGNVTGIERDWMNSRFVTDASNFMIRNITLGYTFNKSNKVFNSARLYGSIQQALVLTKYWGGPNPETSAQNNGQGDGGNLSPGVDLSNYPVPRTFSIGVNLNF
ncbi:TonB-linked outer membrane protein, SusC/RagA family [Spirosomataceae bacterium TFI 002]|nr:TonB-linked outer membrane protein, SusC/RagA family [Spirosomataceae bacterium TFI 002]